MSFLFGSQQELLRSHGLLESQYSTSSGGDRGQRRERLTERRKLHQLKRDHEQQESTRRKVLKLEEGEFSSGSGSDTEGAGKGKNDKERSGQNVDIQVSSEYSRERDTQQQLTLKICIYIYKMVHI